MKIGYKNLFTTTGATVTASTEATGYAKENAYDGFGYDWWKPTATGDSWLKVAFAAAKDADYMAIWGHDLSDHSSSIKPQYSSDDISWSDADTVVSPSDNNTLYFDFTSVSAKYWRVLVNSAATLPAIAGVQIGESLTFEKNAEIGFAPSTIAPVITTKTALSETGVFIGGRKLSEGIKGNINLTNVDPVWVRSTWEPFIDYAQTPAPFVFAWDETNYSSEIVLAWVKDKIPSPSYQTPLLMTLSLSFEGTL